MNVTVNLLAICSLRVANATDGRTKRGARDSTMNALVRQGEQPAMALRMTLAAISVGQRIAEVAGGRP